MVTYNVTKIENEISVLLSTRLAVSKAEVECSTGCLHTKEDVYAVLENALNPTLLGMIADIIAANKEEVSVQQSDEKLYSLDMITEAMGNMNFNSYVNIDNDSAEFQLSYNNCVELNDVEFEVDDEELIEEFENELSLAYNNYHSKNN
jgi:hypothetical protein